MKVLQGRDEENKNKNPNSYTSDQQLNQKVIISSTTSPQNHFTYQTSKTTHC
jgi:hypothetical protein